ncbi:MAG: long-chain fatty acid--CoA ligase [Proteobacteria bacterium]|nr:MAG: long-chain fatty acid--CoA ligase [Pseudomonadota bacterium]
MKRAPGDPARGALDARILGWMREESWRRDDRRFEALARELFAYQFAHCLPYRRFCEARGVAPATLASWREIPAVPTGAFKEIALRSFAAEREVHVFRTSGTSTEKRGVLHLDTLALYEASLLPSFRRGVLPDLAPGARTRIRVLAPPPAELPDSSLSHMFGCVLRAFGDAGSGFDVRGGALDVDGCVAALARAAEEAAEVAVCGTAFAFVHLVDALAERGVRLALPPGSRAMETGGFKGRSRELPAAALYAEIERALGIPPARIVNQYGMCELGSQLYDSVLREPETPRRKLAPPWVRVRIVDPETGADAAPGETGVVHVYDLANTGSVLAIQTADLGRSAGDGIEVLGREPGAEARGCSIAADAMLSR